MSKNIEMQEKTSSSTYEILYPKTSASQVFLSEEAKQATNGLENLDQAASFWGGGQFEIGDVKISARNNLGSKWLACNGDIINKTDYPQLANYCEEKGFPFGNQISEQFDIMSYSDRYPSFQVCGDYYIFFDYKITQDSSASPFVYTFTYHYSQNLFSNNWTSITFTMSDVFNVQWWIGNVERVCWVNNFCVAVFTQGYYIYTSDITNKNSWQWGKIGYDMNVFNAPIVYKDGYYYTMYLQSDYLYGAYTSTLSINSWTTEKCSYKIPIYNYSTTYYEQFIYDESTGWFVLQTSSHSTKGSSYNTHNIFNFKAPNAPILIYTNPNTTESRLIFDFAIENGEIRYWSGDQYAHVAPRSTLSASDWETQSVSLAYQTKIGTHLIETINSTQMTVLSSLQPTAVKTTYTTTDPLKISDLSRDVILDMDDGLTIIDFTSYSNGDIRIQKYPYGIMLPNITITSTNSNVKAYIKGKN